MKTFPKNNRIMLAVFLCVLLLLTACSSTSPESPSAETSGETTSAPTQETPTPETSSSEPEEPASALDETENKAPEMIYFDESWEFAEESAIHSGYSVLYKATSNRKNIVIGVNAGHGTIGGADVKTYCHPDHSEKVTGGSTASGSFLATAVSYGMVFEDGTEENYVTLKMANILKDTLLDAGYDVLMVRDDPDVQLDNVARTIMCNNLAACHIALHWDGDGLDYDKGCFFCSVPEGIRNMYPVSENWENHIALGEALICGLEHSGKLIWGEGSMDIDLTQTSYSTIPSVDIELGNQCSGYDDETLFATANGLLEGIRLFFDE